MLLLTLKVAREFGLTTNVASDKEQGRISANRMGLVKQVAVLGAMRYMESWELDLPITTWGVCALFVGQGTIDAARGPG